MKNNFYLIICAIIITGIFACRKEKLPEPAKTPEKYFPLVKSIIQHNCTISCHAPSLGYLQGLPVILESDSDIVFKGASIKAALTGPFTITNKRMPPSGALSNADIEIVTQWLLKGGRTTDCGLHHE
ncbi:MAG: hypothetical protein ABI763_07745 [Bacteroidota bacterium]